MMVRLDAVFSRQMDVAAVMPMLRSQAPMLGAMGRDVRRRLIEVVGVNLLLCVSCLSKAESHDKCEQS